MLGVATHIGHDLAPVATGPMDLTDNLVITGNRYDAYTNRIGTYETTEPELIADYLGFLSAAAAVESIAPWIEQLKDTSAYLSNIAFGAAIDGLAKRQDTYISNTGGTVVALVDELDAKRSCGYVTSQVRERLLASRPDMAASFQVIDPYSPDASSIIQQPGVRIVLFDDWIGNGDQIGSRLKRATHALELDKETVDSRTEIDLLVIRGDQVARGFFERIDSKRNQPYLVPEVVGYWQTPGIEGPRLIGAPFGAHSTPDRGHTDILQALGRTLGLKVLPMATHISAPYHASETDKPSDIRRKDVASFISQLSKRLKFFQN